MPISSGFYNSVDGDRLYDANSFNDIFQGIIQDGIFRDVGQQFFVTASGDLGLNVSSGRAWFNNTWIYNSSNYSFNATASDNLLNRIDAVVLDFDASIAVRSNTIQYIEGTPSSTPVRPVMLHTADHNQYALCYIYRTAASISITQSDIISVIGTDETPYERLLSPASSAVGREVTILSTDWVGESEPYTATKTVSGVTSTSLLAVSAKDGSVENWIDSGVYAASHGTNTVIFKAFSDKPQTDLTANVIIL